LQRRFVRFIPGNLEEKLEEINGCSFENILDKIPIKIVPNYSLKNSDFVENNIEAYPSWLLADFFIKVIRNSITSIDPPSIESKVVKKFQNDLAKEMRKIGKSLESLELKSFMDLNEKELDQVQRMLNIGHILVAAVYIILHVRHNIVGTPDG
jgi:hypothetical protein